MARGLGALQDSANKAGGTDFLKLKDGESIVMRILTPVEELITVDEHTLEISPGQWRTFTCLHEEGQPCPLCEEMGHKARPSTYLPFLNVANKKVSIFKASPTVAASILALVEEYGDITSRDFKLSRKGTGFDTKYIFLPKDKDQSIQFPTDVTIPNIENMTKCKSVDTIRKELAGMPVADENEAPSDDTPNTSNNATAAADGEPDYPF